MTDSKPPPRKKKNEQNFYVAFLGVGISIATEVGVACFIGYFIGNWLDLRYGTTPYLMLLLMITFLAVSLFHATIVLKHLVDRMDKGDR